jgi:heme-degrading monooxygenase HmoA
VIARVWSARTTRAYAPAYVAHLRAHVLPELQALAGYAGAMLLERDEGGGVEIVVLTTWASLDAVRGFAGDDLERAVVADEAAAILTDYDRRVRHYELRVNERAPDA